MENASDTQVMCGAPLDTSQPNCASKWTSLSAMVQQGRGGQESTTLSNGALSPLPS
jgi:hypothetical protein